jgi:Ca2+/Na+ antiporter
MNLNRDEIRIKILQISNTIRKLTWISLFGIILMGYLTISTKNLTFFIFAVLIFCLILLIIPIFFTRKQKKLVQAVMQRTKEDRTVNVIKTVDNQELDHKLNPSLIEVYDIRETLEGFVEGRKYFDKNKNIKGYIDGRAYKLPDGYIILSLDENNFIIDENNKEVGYFENGYFRFPNEWISFGRFTGNNVDRGFSK